MTWKPISQAWAFLLKLRTVNLPRSESLPVFRHNLTDYGTTEGLINKPISLIVKFRINWALSNSLNTYNRHSDWHKLEVCGTNVSIYF